MLTDEYSAFFFNVSDPASVSKTILSLGHEILTPTAPLSNETVSVGLHKLAVSTDTSFTMTAATLGPIGIRPILYIGSVEQNSPSPTKTSSFEHRSSI